MAPFFGKFVFQEDITQAMSDKPRHRAPAGRAMSHGSRIRIGRMRLEPRLAALLCASVLAAGCATLAATDPNALWQIVHFDCTAAARSSGRTGLCAAVDLDRHFAILKDRSGIAQHLLIPTERVSGIESPAMLAPDAPNYWADAWQARSYVQASLVKAHRHALADDQLGLEINSAYRRSQDQLHIHIDCMSASGSAALAKHRYDVAQRWTWDTIDGARYRVMHIDGPTLRVDPFDIVARDRPGAMAMQTILVTGAGPWAQRDGWLIVNSATDVDGGTGSAEVLLDHRCEAAGPI